MIVLALLAVLILVWSCLRVSGKADEEYIAELDDFNEWGKNSDGF